jgi:tRNA-2-methylthio-N6-dimethylallyladenosine synthase
MVVNPRSYYIWTIGCQMNVADSERVAALLESANMRPAATLQQADVIILNSCVVRQGAEDKVIGELGMLKSLKQRRPDVLLGLMGCMVTDETRPALEKRFPHVDVFFNVLETNRLLAKLGNGHDRPTASQSAGHALATTQMPEASDQAGPWSGENGVEFGAETGQAWYPGLAPEFLDAHALGPTKYVPVIYGCNMHCTFCIIPSRRGRERSRPLAEILAEARRLAEHGVREITLLGQTVDAYGHDLPPSADAIRFAPLSEDDRSRRPDLADLLAALSDIPDLWRLRFLTSHPLWMTDRIISAVAQLPKVCPCINIPVQAGHDDILAAMRRGYTVDRYRRLVDKIRAAIPGVAVTTDLIVGFPGESEEHFLASYRLIEEIAFDVVHVAAFSPRPGTVAARLADDVPLEEKKRRLQAIENLQEGIARRINERLVGSTVEILVEGAVKGKWMGRTRTDKIVFFEDDGQWTGKLVNVRIEKAGPWSLQGIVQTCADHRAAEVESP